MLNVQVMDDEIWFGHDFAISFQRTLRIPDDGRSYPLPPGLGRFPLVDRMTPSRSAKESGRTGRFFLPMYQVEALWLSFSYRARGAPHAVKIGIGGINAVSGEGWDLRLRRAQRNRRRITLSHRRSPGWTGSTPAKGSFVSSSRCLWDQAILRKHS